MRQKDRVIEDRQARLAKAVEDNKSLEKKLNEAVKESEKIQVKLDKAVEDNEKLEETKSYYSNKCYYLNKDSEDLEEREKARWHYKSNKLEQELREVRANLQTAAKEKYRN